MGKTKLVKDIEKWVGENKDFLKDTFDRQIEKQGLKFWPQLARLFFPAGKVVPYCELPICAAHNEIGKKLRIKFPQFQTVVRDISITAYSITNMPFYYRRRPVSASILTHSFLEDSSGNIIDFTSAQTLWEIENTPEAGRRMALVRSSFPEHSSYNEGIGFLAGPRKLLRDNKKELEYIYLAERPTS